jgi:predicted alpha-1,2-mannosidase
MLGKGEQIDSTVVDSGQTKVSFHDSENYPTKIRRIICRCGSIGLGASRPWGDSRSCRIRQSVDRCDTSQKLGEGKTFPGATTPFGLVQLSPDTMTGGDNAPGYSYEHTTMEGFSFTHMSGVGWYGDFGNLLTMPTTGPLQFAAGRPEHPDEGWRSLFSHATEVAQAGYYAVTLERYKIRAELSAAPHAGILRFTFPRSTESRILLDLARRIGGTSTRQYVKVAGKNAIEGWVHCTPKDGGWGNGDGQVEYTLYFRTEFSTPMNEFGVVSIDLLDGRLQGPSGLVGDYFLTDDYYARVKNGRVMRNFTEQEGRHLVFFTQFPTSENQQVLTKTGISYVSPEGARGNLTEDIPDWNFEQVRRRSWSLWNQTLSCITIEGATETQHTIFNTALYHAMIDPRSVSDVDGKYVGADKKTSSSSSYAYRTIFSGWDVFRAEFPLMTILRPGVINDEINSLLELAERSGRGYLERWEIMNAYSGCMDGDPGISVILDAYAKGIRNFDIEKAYAACRQTAAGTGTATNRPDNDFYLEKGYVPDQVSWTLDNAYYDWCVSRFAEYLGKSEDAKVFGARARNYRDLYDPGVGFMRAKDRGGQRLEWLGETAFGQGCTESNPLQQTWFVPHDIYGLIDLMGKDRFMATLEDMFQKTPATFGWNPYYNHSNEPVHHIPYLFVYAGQPWLTQEWVRRILEQAYHAEVNGICGNDDVGQMSAWYVISALGFYPVCPGDNVYVLGSPLFGKAVIQLDSKWHKGKTFAIVAHNNSSANCYVQSAQLNGKSLQRAWITHAEITSGGVLEFVMGALPNFKWGTSMRVPSGVLSSV